jgi:hypothetical protein
MPGSKASEEDKEPQDAMAAAEKEAYAGTNMLLLRIQVTLCSLLNQRSLPNLHLLLRLPTRSEIHMSDDEEDIEN